MNHQSLSAFIWSVADLLRGDYKQSDYGKVILPFTVLRRLDCVLEATKPAVLEELAKREAAGVNPEPFLLRAAKQLGTVVVALTTDEESVQKKGYHPELSYAERKEILEALKYVDEVVPSPK